ncbi:MAG TPA: hypothetical protein VHW00_15545 [Thermoanaerobaculia bacterium]|nr:hypothetical protein [Thermoanaerobaculia bacterium]
MHVHVYIVTFLFLWTSGVMAAAALRLRTHERLVTLALQFGLGLSVWPVIFLFTTKLGVAIPAVAMRAIVYATILAGLLLFALQLRRVRWGRVRPALPLLATFALLSILAVATRLSHIRGLAFPPWVDGVHHAMIVRLLLEHGLVPATADPYIPGGAFFYHWGFHVPAAFVAAATRASEMPTFLLHYGQALNALSLLMVYAAGRVLLRSREAGLIAASLAVFVSYYPGFYLSWGRYTHLAGTLVLPPLLIALWKLARTERPMRWLSASAILASGVLLIHVRVALFALVFAVVLLAATRPFVVRTLARWAIAALLAALLALPWLIVLARNPHVGEVIAPAANRGLPLHLIASTHNRELLAIATAGVSGLAGWFAMPIAGRALSAAWWLVIVLVSRRKTRTRRAPWPALQLLGAFVLLLAIALYWKPLGFDLTGFATLDSAIITMFLPLSLGGAALIVWVLRMRGLDMFVLILAMALAGAATTTNIVNSQTVFTEEADLRAMRWIEKNIPADAVFAIEGRPWMAPAFVGVDGGYWLQVTTGRRVNLPPLLYAWSLPRARVNAINATVQELRPKGATHIYVGARGSESRRKALLSTNAVRLIYRDGAVAIFEVR